MRNHLKMRRIASEPPPSLLLAPTMLQPSVWKGDQPYCMN